tara:strand:+ start:245 stop:499 length:255 start_codon:yes stop_codon:yes gene_type:complete
MSSHNIINDDETEPASISITEGISKTETVDQMAASFNTFISDMRIVDDSESSMKNIIDKVSPSKDINDILTIMNSMMECRKRMP